MSKNPVIHETITMHSQIEKKVLGVFHKKDYPVIIMDAIETLFIDLPANIEARRTRDHRYYREQFGVTGFRMKQNQSFRSSLPLDDIEKILLDTDFFSLAWFRSYKDGMRDQFLRDYGTEAEVRRLNEIARKHPHVLNIMIFMEIEGAFYRGIPPSATPKEAYEHWRRMAYQLTAGEHRSRIDELFARKKSPSLRDWLNTIYGAEYDPSLTIAAFPHAGYWAIHPEFDWGADLVCLETGHWAGNVQIAISFLRGGAREYGRKWALDPDPWNSGSHTYGRGPTTYNMDGRHVAGATAENLWFSWMSALLAGADAIVYQNLESGFFRFPHPTLFGPSNCDLGESSRRVSRVESDYFRTSDPGEWGAPLSPVGEYAKRLAKLKNDPSFERGQPVVPIATMVELWHGWTPHMFACGDWAWTGKVPFHRGDRMLSELFAAFFPGHEQSGNMGDPVYNPDAPFTSELEMMEMLYNGMDMRPYEKGNFVPTPLGDSFDVVTDQISLEKLQKYSMTILAGRLSLTPKNFPQLKKYVEAGGTLVLHALGLGLHEDGHDLDVPQGYRQQVQEFIGCQIKQWYGLGFFPSIWRETGERFREGKYEYAVVELRGARPLVVGDKMVDYTELGVEQWAGNNEVKFDNPRKAMGDLKSRVPVVTVNQVGKGRVIFCTPHHHLTARGKQMVAGVKEALLRLIDPMVPVKIEGRPIQFHVNRIQDGYLVGLFNWSKIPWIGRVEMRRMKGAIKQVEELLEKRQPPLEPSVAGNSFSAAVEPYGICLYRVRGNA